MTEKNEAKSAEFTTPIEIGPEVQTMQDSLKRGWLGTLFFVDFVGPTLVVVPNIKGGGFRYAALQREANALRKQLEDTSIGGLVIDLHALDYLGSEAIGALVALARKAKDVGNRAVFCRAAPRLQTALTNMGLHRLWPLYRTREEALDAIAEVGECSNTRVA